MEPVAVIGMGCRFPGAPDIETFWQLMCRGGDAIREVPASRYDIEAVYDPRPATPGKVMSRYGGFLENIDQFDAAFFGISPREVAKMDPQHRLLLEVAWEAMEDAGQVTQTMTEEERLDIGCFMGVITGDYWDRQFRVPSNLDVYVTTGSARSGAAGRISFSQNLMGTSFAIDAACSSSLVAVDQAVQNLRSGACTLALAGGVNVILTPEHTIGFSQGKMMAADGHCKTYDAAADGYVRSEGAGVVVLKLLSQARRDGDRIHAVIRGCASNNDGHCASFMAPSTEGQQAGLRKACRNAHVAPSSIEYVEAHGPGTQAGDPIEMTTLGEVLCAGRPPAHPLLVGSVKTNIGHTEGAAGVAGLIKAVLCLKHGMIPPHLHFHTPNPAIPWSKYALQVPNELVPWPDYSVGPRRALVCSYGIAGTNTYVIVEEVPHQATSTAPLEQSTVLLPLSARTPEALTDLARRYLTHLESETGIRQTLGAIAATASLRRTHHEHRLALVGSSKTDVYAKLAAFVRGQADLGMSCGQQPLYTRPRVAWIFPGQGSQWLGMGRDLFEQEPIFRATIEQCHQVMQAYAGWSLLAQFQDGEEQPGLSEIDIVQPTLFALEVALAALWRSWGITPDVVVGHSMGEIAAAYIAGALSLEDAAWIICARSKLLRRVCGQGAMAVVELSLEHARILANDYPGQISVAVSNSPNSTVLAGDPQALAEILDLLEKQHIFGRLVNVDIASHSPQMDPLRSDLLTLLERVQPQATSIPMLSTVTGAFVDGCTLDAPYWANNLREPVLFLSAMQRLLADGYTLFLEVSPHPILVGAIRQTIEQSEARALALPSLCRQEEGRVALLSSLGTLYAQGCEINWSTLSRGKRYHVSLPTYPWQRQRYWNAALDYPEEHTRSWRTNGKGHPILGNAIPSALHPDTFSWTCQLDTESFPYLGEHCVHHTPVFPGAAYLELSLAAASEICGPHSFVLEKLQLTRALFFPQGTSYLFQMVLTPREDGMLSLRFFSTLAGHERPSMDWTEHASVIVRPLAEPANRFIQPHPTPEVVPYTWTLSMEASAYYMGLRARGIQHGPLFQGITHIWRCPNQVMMQLSIPETLKDDLPGYIVHPAVLDAILQGITPFLPIEPVDETYVPVAIRRSRFYRRPEDEETLWVHAVVHASLPTKPGALEGNVSLLNAQGEVLLEIEGFRLQSLGGDTTREFQRQRLQQLLYTLQWQPQVNDASQEQSTERKNWLIFSEQNGLGEYLAEHLRSVGACCVIVVPGASYQQVATQQYMLPPADPQAFHRLFTELYQSDEDYSCHGIIYLWGLLTAPAQHNALDLEQDLAETSVLHVLQASLAMKKQVTPRLWLITNGVHAIENQETSLSLLQAPLWGMGRVMVYEHQDWRTTLIDLNTPDPLEQATALFREICSDNAEDEVALRGEQRYVARLVRHQLAEQKETSLFHSDATYLITGGLGGVGLRTAQWMIEQGARHLVLLGRHEMAQSVAEQVQTLRANGAKIYPMQVDVSQEQQLANALALVRRDLPPLRGIFHSAVVLDDGTLLQLDRARLRGVRLPKIDGAWNLHRLTLADPLDYFVLFSSAASLIGSPGQGNYAAANAFLDQLAFYRRQQGYPALCISWGRWGEVGQATREKRGERLDARGFASMRPIDGLAILGELLRQSPAHVGVMSFSLSRWSQFYPHLTRSSLFVTLTAEHAAQAERQERHLTREMLVELDEKEREQTLFGYLNEQISRVLGHRSALHLEGQQLLNRLGLDSLMSVELKNRLGSDLKIAIPATTFLQDITLAQFVASLVKGMA